MKKHLVMIVGMFYPTPSPTGNCAEAYVDLLKDQFDISVICLADTDRVQYDYNGKQVYPAAGWYTIFQHRLKKKAPRFLQNFFKIPVHLRQWFTQPNNLYSYVKAARKQLEAIDAQRPIDVIFSVGAPMAAHVAASHFRKKNPQVHWVTYTVDSYGAQNKGAAKAQAFESDILAQSDHVLLSEEIYDNSPALYATFAEKCEPLPYLMPLTPQRAEGEQYFEKDKTNLVYAGRFYKTIRNPEYLLQLALEMDENCVLHLYCQSDCDGVIDDYVRRSGGKIVRHAPVSVEEIQRIYTQADALVNVGNNTSEFKPSKTFEYIATGKPILNIYYEGQFDNVLAQSPITLQLSRSLPAKEAVAALQDFLKTTGARTISRQEIDKLFPKYSSENIATILIEILEVSLDK
ncbi:MAG: hypothetical protein J6Q92_06035 [Oscillospiraceae bacterium]|nr:hypothetical protein [Oscillospiraceae bacterium]